MTAYAIVDGSLSENDDCYVLTFPVCADCMRDIQDNPGRYDLRPTSAPRPLKLTEHNRTEECAECERTFISAPTRPVTYGGNRFDYA